MKRFILVCLLGALSPTVLAAPENPCDTAEALIGFVEDHLRTALSASELEISRYHAYKALNTIEKSRNNFEACECDYAREHILESLENLKLATRISTLEGTRIVLKRALRNARASEESLIEHEGEHHKGYDNRVLAMNTTSAADTPPKRDDEASKDLEARIDQSLLAYRNSLEEVVSSVPCDEALVFVRRVYAHCERQLLREDLTAPKRYYNLQTKEITENALDRLRACAR